MASKGIWYVPGAVRKPRRSTRGRGSARRQSPAMTVVWRRQRLDGEYQDRPGGGSVLSFGSVTFAGPLVGGCSKIGFSMVFTYPWSFSPLLVGGLALERISVCRIWPPTFAVQAIKPLTITASR